MKNKLVSIIVLSYNNLDYIKENLDTIIEQDYNNIEVIIADDCSRNFNTEIYKEYIKKRNKGNIRYVNIYSNKENLGTVKNINNAIKLAKGEYIKLIAADDAFYCNNTISTLIEFLQNSPEDVLVTNIQICDEQLNPLEEYTKKNSLNSIPKEEWACPIKMYKRLATGNFIPAPGVLFKKKFFEKFGYFDETYTLLEDWPMWLKICRQNQKMCYKDFISVKYRKGVGVSNTPNKKFKFDEIKCNQNEILKYKKLLGRVLYRKIKFNYILNFEYENFSILKKIIIKIIYFDIIFYRKLKKILVSLHKLLNNYRNKAFFI